MAILPKQIRDMYDNNGRLNARAMASAIGEDTTALARVFGVKPDTVLKNPVTDKIQGEAQRLVFLFETLTAHFGGDWKYAKIWLRKPHPFLDNRSPLNVILNHKEGLTAIIGMAMQMREGIPG